jgi:hypothetical protein
VGATGGARGAAYLFDVTTGQELAKLTSADVPADGGFGTSVAISDNVAVVGADRDGHAGFSSGSAYLFDVSTHKQLAKLTATDAAAVQYLGESVSISGSHALVGSAGAAPFGAAYVFSAVPEPASLAIFTVSMPLIVGRKSRRRSVSLAAMTF